MRILKMICYFPVVCFAIPADYVAWNLYMALIHGYTGKSFKEIVTENWETYEEKINE